MRFQFSLFAFENLCELPSKPSVRLINVFLTSTSPFFFALTDDPKYLEEVLKIRDYVNANEKDNGLYLNYIHPETGKRGQRECLMFCYPHHSTVITLSAMNERPNLRFVIFQVFVRLIQRSYFCNYFYKPQEK